MVVTTPRNAMMNNGEDGHDKETMNDVNHHSHAMVIDGGSNCSIAGTNIQLLSYAHPKRLVNISGIGGATMNNIRIGSFATVTFTKDGERILLIFHEYAHLTEGHTDRSIQSILHIRDGGSIVSDTPT